MAEGSPKFLIVPAFAKCGTTLLHSVFEAIPEVSTPRETKEIKYFITDNPSLEDYLTYFPADIENPGLYFESSPPYFSGRSLAQCSSACDNILKTLDTPHILVCLRQPVARAFSHYIHDLQAFARWGKRQHKVPDDPDSVFKRPPEASFAKAIEHYTNISDHYFEKVKLCIDRFGAQNCSFFFLEHDAGNFSEFGASLANDIGIEMFHGWPDESPKVLESYGCPQYFLGGTEVTSRENRTFHLPEDKVLVSTSFGSMLLECPDRQKAQDLVDVQKKWTNHLTASEAERIYTSNFKEDFEKTLELLEGTYGDKYSDQIRFYREFQFKDKALPKANPRARFMEKMGLEER